ncbi:PAAR domain-containing protein [Nannocystis punicea]|uniref:PAAR domain-containing protein n=1 Tax=Nannocystis punicea TaxID=2995304 RepID=A0ABY7HBF6_9BACT|nr:PAAR domain-containing protein [Nannocystis poenicansa]WAS96593.1 PAAR domain-containing protein [Nannocystis poenicansa]
MPDAARISDFHVCPKVEPGPVPHVGGPIFSGSANVIIGFLPAAREGDSVVCFPLGAADRIKQGSSTVVINGRPAARRSDPGSHISGDLIAAGCPTVVIGDSTQAFTFRSAAKRGVPLCEECERKRRQFDEKDDSAEPPAPDTATLDDETPPPGAELGRDLLSSSLLNKQELAAQPNLNDGLDTERVAARIAVAYQFYAAHAGEKFKPSKLTSHIRAIDLSQPVEVIAIAAQVLHQRGYPGGKNGEYFAFDPDLTPEQLGTSSIVPGPNGTRVPRDRRTVEFGEAPAFALKSIAASVIDTWTFAETATDPGEQIPCEGGGMQVYVPRTFHVSSRNV